jgi:hypothetical protein
MGDLNKSWIEWGVASKAIAGQRESGDVLFAKVYPDEVLLAVIDGLGHGDGAVLAARKALATLERSDGVWPISLVQRCHEELRSTRGVVMSLAMFRRSDDSMTWLGVGNVEGFLLHRNTALAHGQEALLLRGGVIGDRLPTLSTSTLRVGHGDVLIFATDGIRPGFTEHINGEEVPQRMAEKILDQYGRDTDDALVLVARYLHGKETAPPR